MAHKVPKNNPHPQPGSYGSHGVSAQTMGYASVFEPKSHNNHTSALNKPVEMVTDQLGRTKTKVPTNNSNPVHVKENVNPTHLD